MNVKQPIFFFLCLTLLSISPAIAQSSDQKRPVVGIAGFNADTNKGIRHEIDATICDVLKFTLTFTGSYDVVRLEAPYHTEDLKDLRETCKHQQLDNIIVGSTSSNENRKVDILVRVYDLKEDRITSSENVTLANLMDLLELSHSLTAKVIEGFSGVHVEYGDISIQYFGDPQDLDLYVDSNLIGRKIEQINNMVAGTHTFALRNHNNSSSTELLTKKVDIRPGKENTLQFMIPIVEPKSADQLTQLDASIAANWYENREGNILIHQHYTKCKTEQAYEIIRKSKYPESRRLLNKYEWWEQLAKSYNKITPEQSEFSYKLVQSINSQLDDYVQIRHQANNCTILQKSIRELTENMLPYAHIKVDGKIDDWEGIEASITDSIGDPLEEIKGNDFTAFYIAIDSEYIYVRYDVADGPPNYENKNWYNVKLGTLEPHTIGLKIGLDNTNFITQTTTDNFRSSQVSETYNSNNDVAINGNHIEARFSNRNIRNVIETQKYKAPPSFRIECIEIGLGRTMFEYKSRIKHNYLWY